MMNEKKRIDRNGIDCSNVELHKKRKQKNQLLYLIAVLFICTLEVFWTSSFLAATGTFFLLYIIHDVLLSDHIYYDIRSDYQYEFTGAESLDVSLVNGVFAIPKKWQTDYTLLLAIRVDSTLFGRLFDPVVLVSSSEKNGKQYFERACEGIRYINLSNLMESRLNNIEENITIRTQFCRLAATGKVHAFRNPELLKKKLLIISPHADDAEIAAFNLYRSHNSMVVTITAGEAEPETFSRYPGNRQEASVLKGRVRAWDSIAIPQWAGVSKDRIINLGYFCMGLKDMFVQPETAMRSRFADTMDTRVFREFNSVKLKSDSHGTASWQQLVADLQELIEGFRPEVIVSPHPSLDTHVDHQYSTRAVTEALDNSSLEQNAMLYYMNHVGTTDMHPFGCSHSLVSLPPSFGEIVSLEGVFSFPLTEEDQRDKILSLEMQHDLRRPIKFRKWLRKRLQRLLIGRHLPDYGEDDYLRRAVRQNELFVVANRFNQGS